MKGVVRRRGGITSCAMRTRASIILLALVALVALCSSTAFPAGPATMATVTTQPSDASTWLYHLPGMGGLMNIDRNVTSGIVAGGLKARVEIYDWTGTDRGLVALGNVQRHEEQAKL